MKLTKNTNQASEIASWENEGGASFPVSDDGMEHDEDVIFLYLGRSVVSNWKRLPIDFQRLVLEDTTANVSSSESIGLRESIARFLHVHGGGYAPPNRRRSDARASEHSVEGRSRARNSSSPSPGYNCQ